LDAAASNVLSGASGAIEENFMGQPVGTQSFAL
jgi:hypothetical protein